MALFELTIGSVALLSGVALIWAGIIARHTLLSVIGTGITFSGGVIVLLSATI